ncbi:MAG: hypothetical protein ACE5GX_14285 [Thermoanaerobaculia bacterium]
MLIDRFIAQPDALEVHRIEIPAAPEVVYPALWRTDLGSSWIVKLLLGLRALPGILLGRRSLVRPPRLDLEAIIAAGFGKLAEEPGREIVLGVVGRFWRPTGNLLPFDRASFDGPVPAGLAIAAWNFTVRPTDRGSSVLETETRIACGDDASRRKFRLYWLLVRPFSGWIRRRMLAAVLREVSRLSARATS